MAQPHQEIVDTQTYNKFVENYSRLSVAHTKAVEGNSEYWWRLWVIERDNLWQAAYPSKMDYLGTLCAEDFGPAQQTHYNVMWLAELMHKLGASDDEMKKVFGHLNTANTVDIRKLHDKNGDPLPEVKSRLDERGETVLDLIQRTAELGRGEARKAVKDYVEHREIYSLRETLVIEDDRVMCNVRFNESGKFLGDYTLSLKFSDATDGRSTKIKDQDILFALVSWAIGRLGMRL